MEPTIACFVSPHGFGHAARCCAVMQALAGRQGRVRFHIFTRVPEWFFRESLDGDFGYHRCAADVGLVQETPLVEDLGRTVAELERAPWRNEQTLEDLEAKLAALGVAAVISDISPLGLRLARRMGLPSVLLENFTWDWIYRNLGAGRALESCADELAPIFASADLRIQTTPLCHLAAGAVRVAPVARAPRTPRAAVRRRLGIRETDDVVLASMGGVGWDYGSLDDLSSGEGPWIVVPGGSDSLDRRGRLLLLPFHSSHYHPDLVGACDLVAGKLGYSTVAEAVHGGSAFAYVERPRFPESPILAEFVDQHLTSARIEESDFVAGNWLPAVEELLTGERKRPVVENGADQAAAAIVERLPEVFG